MIQLNAMVVLGAVHWTLSRYSTNESEPRWAVLAQGMEDLEIRDPGYEDVAWAASQGLAKYLSG